MPALMPSTENLPLGLGRHVRPCRDRELAYPRFWSMRTLMNVDETTQNSSHATRHIPEAARAKSIKAVRARWRSALDIWMLISYSFRYAGAGVLSFRSCSGRSAAAVPNFTL